MKLTEILAPDFDLAMTLDSGQVFHWEKASHGFVGTIENRAVCVEQRGDLLFVAGEREDLAHKYFALDHRLAAICASFPSDPVMNAAKEFCRGLRIIRQPKWECLATFICSSMKQVAHIRQISKKMRERFGEARNIGDYVVYAFPPADRVAGASEHELRKCGLGYRARNLRATAKRIASREVDLDSWSAPSDQEL